MHSVCYALYVHAVAVSALLHVFSCRWLLHLLAVCSSVFSLCCDVAVVYVSALLSEQCVGCCVCQFCAAIGPYAPAAWHGIRPAFSRTAGQACRQQLLHHWSHGMHRQLWLQQAASAVRPGVIVWVIASILNKRGGLYLLVPWFNACFAYTTVCCGVLCCTVSCLGPAHIRQSACYK